MNTREREREARLSDYVTNAEATAILSANSGHKVGERYIRSLAAQGYVRVKKLSARLTLYLRADVEGYIVRTKRGPKPRGRARQAA